MEEIKRRKKQQRLILSDPLPEYAQSSTALSQAPHPQPAIQHFFRYGPTRRRSIIILIVAASIMSISFCIYCFISWRQTFPPALPENIRSSVLYQVYYPSQVPAGYRFKTDSAKSHNGLLFFKFTHGKKVITVTEQAAPAINLDFSKIEGGYTTLLLPLGKAAVGTSVGNPSIIIVTDTTLISINSNKGVSKNDVLAVAQKIKPVDL